MSAVAFDSLHYAHQLEAAGMPRAQAEVIAQGLTSMFVHNFDALVTKDYLDARLGGMDARLGGMDAQLGGMDARLDSMDARLEGIDTRLVGIDTRLEGIDTRLVGMDAMLGNMDARLGSFSIGMDSKLNLLSAEIDGKLGKLYVMLSVIVAGVAVPIIQTFITWLA